MEMNIRDTITAMYDVVGKATSLCRIIEKGEDLSRPAVQKMLREEAKALKAALATARDGLNGPDED